MLNRFINSGMQKAYSVGISLTGGETIEYAFLFVRNYYQKVILVK